MGIQEARGVAVYPFQLIHPVLSVVPMLLTRRIASGRDVKRLIGHLTPISLVLRESPSISASVYSFNREL